MTTPAAGIPSPSAAVSEPTDAERQSAIVALLRDQYGFPEELAMVAAWRARSALRIVRQREQASASPAPVAAPSVARPVETRVSQGPSPSAAHPVETRVSQGPLPDPPTTTPDTTVEEPPPTTDYDPSESFVTDAETTPPAVRPQEPKPVLPAEPVNREPAPKPAGPPPSPPPSEPTTPPERRPSERILVIECPKCSFPMKLPESQVALMLGRRARCPQCQVKFLLPSEV